MLPINGEDPRDSLEDRYRKWGANALEKAVDQIATLRGMLWIWEYTYRNTFILGTIITWVYDKVDPYLAHLIAGEYDEPGYLDKLLTKYKDFIAAVDRRMIIGDLVFWVAAVLDVRFDSGDTLSLVLKRWLWRDLKPLYSLWENPGHFILGVLGDILDVTYTYEMNLWDVLMLYVAIHYPSTYLLIDDPGDWIVRKIALALDIDYELGDTLGDIVGKYLGIDWPDLWDIAFHPLGWVKDRLTDLFDLPADFWLDPIAGIKELVIDRRDEWVRNSSDWLQEIGESVLRYLIEGVW